MSMPTNPYDNPEPVEPIKEGMSGTTKTLLGIGIGCGVFLLLCCGGFTAFTYMAGKTIGDAATEKPEDIQALTESIVTIKIPPEFGPKMGMDIVIPWVGTRVMTWVAYEAKDDKGGLFLVQFNSSMFNDDMVKQWKESMKEQGNHKVEDIELSDSEPFETKINDAPANFLIGKGHDSDKDRDVWQASGTFQGKAGPAMLFMQVDAETITKEQIVELLESMN